jgi:hypothetical protein
MYKKKHMRFLIFDLQFCEKIIIIFCFKLDNTKQTFQNLLNINFLNNEKIL